MPCNSFKWKQVFVSSMLLLHCCSVKSHLCCTGKKEIVSHLSQISQITTTIPLGMENMFALYEWTWPQTIHTLRRSLIAMVTVWKQARTQTTVRGYSCIATCQNSLLLPLLTLCWQLQQSPLKVCMKNVPSGQTRRTADQTFFQTAKWC